MEENQRMPRGLTDTALGRVSVPKFWPGPNTTAEAKQGNGQPPISGTGLCTYRIRKFGLDAFLDL